MVEIMIHLEKVATIGGGGVLKFLLPQKLLSQKSWNSSWSVDLNSFKSLFLEKRWVTMESYFIYKKREISWKSKKKKNGLLNTIVWKHPLYTLNYGSCVYTGATMRGWNFTKETIEKNLLKSSQKLK